MMDEKADSGVKAGVLGLNGLTFSLPPDMSVAVSRSLTRQFPQQQVHSPRDVMTFVLNTGSSFIDAADSFLSIDVVNTSTGGGTDAANVVWFGSNGGSACNLFSRISVTSRSGQSIERIDRANQLASIRCQYEHPVSWHEKGPGTAAGIAETIDSATTGLNWLPGAANKIRFCIPLPMISVFFASCGSMLPSQLMSGLRVELSCDDALTALQTKALGVTPGYSIVAASLNLMSYQLSDICLRTLSEASASQGLEITSKACYSVVGQRTSTVLNLDISKSASRVLSAFYRERPATKTDSSKDSFASVPYDANYYVAEEIWRLGSLYFPSQSIRADSHRTSSPEIYCQALQCFNTFTKDAPNNYVSEYDFRNGSAIIGVSTERSQVLGLAGQPSSNSRILSLTARFYEGTAGLTREFEAFMIYVQLVRCFSSNVTVEQ